MGMFDPKKRKNYYSGDCSDTGSLRWLYQVFFLFYYKKENWKLEHWRKSMKLGQQALEALQAEITGRIYIREMTWWWQERQVYQVRWN